MQVSVVERQSYPSSIVIKRFWKKVDIKSEDECWPFTGAIDPETGYGRFWWREPNAPRNTAYLIGAHKFALLLKLGRLPRVRPGSRSKQTLVLHSCDNRPCCNVKHLSLG